MYGSWLVKELEKEASGEEIVGCVMSTRKKLETDGKLIDWPTAKTILLSREMESTQVYVHGIYAWTATRILYKGYSEEDCYIDSIPRNPIDCIPYPV
jgi:hypothetical protein